jgi:hypothetical protein
VRAGSSLKQVGVTTLKIREGFLTMLRLTRHSALWIAVFILAIAWPPIYSIFVHPVVYPSLVRGFVSPDELKQLLDARRYTIEVPMELDGHFLQGNRI